MMEGEERTGLAVNDNAAVKIVDGKLEVITSGEEGKAYIFDNGEKSELMKNQKIKLED